MPEVEELVKTNPPTFNGKTSLNVTATSSPHTLHGECDTRSFGLEYSFDQTTWIELSGGCPSNGEFSLEITLNPTREVFARGRTKMGFTSTAKAFVRLVLPQTAPTFATVTAGSVKAAGQDMGVEATVSSGASLEELDNGLEILNTGVLGIVYGD